MSVLLAQDVISGQDGWVYATDNRGNVVHCGDIKSISATITRNKVEIRTLNYNAAGTSRVKGRQQKVVDWSGAGTVTMYHLSPFWIGQINNYIQTGKDWYFTMQVINDDPGSNVGKQRITLTECNMDNIEIAKLDVNADTLESTFNFTFSGVMPSDPSFTFNEITGVNSVTGERLD